MKGTEWQIRAKKAGLDQETLRQLLGLSKANLSLGIRGEWASGVPQNIKVAIFAWELMNEAQRQEWVRMALAERAKASTPETSSDSESQATSARKRGRQA